MAPTPPLLDDMLVFAEVVGAGGITATWCAPCRAINPTVEALATEYKGRVKVAKLDIDDNQATAQEYGIRSVPTLLLFKQGKVVGQIVGAVPRARMESALQQVL